MRTVSGRTDSVVVVGAGLGGLSAALRLAGAGRQVTLLERESTPGGRAGVLELDGYRFDTGRRCHNAHLIATRSTAWRAEEDAWTCSRSPLYRAFYPDGSSLDVHAKDASRQIERVCSGPEAAGYRRYVDFVSELYRLEMRDFIDRNIDSPLDLITPDLARLVALGGFRRLAPKVRQFLRDPRTVRLFSFQSMYAGLAPQDALAIYAVIAYMDSVAGVYFPRGGMHAVPKAMAGALEKHGVTIAYDREVTRVELRGRCAVAVHTADGDRIPCDAVVLNPDLPVARRDLLGRPLRRRLAYSPSCFLLLAGSSASYGKIAHHNIHFGRSWNGVFRELIDERRLMTDPSILVTNPTHSDPSLAPAGKHSYYVLFPTPNLDALSTGASKARGIGTRWSACSSSAGTSGSATPSRWSRSRHRSIGSAVAWSGARRSPRRTPSSKPARSGRPTCGGTTSCSSVRGHNRGWASRWCWCRGDWLPNASSDPTRRTGPARGAEVGR